MPCLLKGSIRSINPSLANSVNTARTTNRKPYSTTVTNHEDTTDTSEDEEPLTSRALPSLKRKRDESVDEKRKRCDLYDLWKENLQLKNAKLRKQLEILDMELSQRRKEM